jgi:PAS domain S-box-containing protein
VLGTSAHLKSGDLEAFHRQVVDLSRRLEVQIVLRDPKLDRQVVHSAFPWGTPLVLASPPERRKAEEQIRLTRQPAVTDLFFGPLVKKHIVGIVAPIFEGADIRYFLSIGIPAKRFADILDVLQSESDRVIGVVDRNHMIVARSQRNDVYVGTRTVTPTPPDRQGVVRATGRDGTLTHWYYRRSDVSGWSVPMGVPDHVLNAPLHFAFAGFAVGGGSLLLIAMAISYALGGRLSTDIGKMQTALAMARRRGREQFQALFEAVPSGIAVIDRAGTIVLVNVQMERLFGLRRAEMIGRPIEAFIPACPNGWRAAEQLSTTDNGWAEPERQLYGLRNDGSEFPVEIGLSPFATSDGSFLIATLVDITERKSAEQERQELRRRIVQGQEWERLRLAHELHDQTGQTLTAAILELKGVETQVDDIGRGRVQNLRRHLDEIGRTLHHVALELRPASIDDLGLEHALSDYISAWSAQYGVEADFHCGDCHLDDLTEEVRTTIYRVVQEGLTNVARHAGATSLSVVIDCDATVLRLTIEDNGSGFDASSIADGRARRLGSGLGVAGMRERLTLIGGSLEIESTPGADTTLFVRIPLDEDNVLR